MSVFCHCASLVDHSVRPHQHFYASAHLSRGKENLEAMRLPKVLVVLFAITIAVLTFLPINNYFRGSSRDYGKWFRVGQTVIGQPNLLLLALMLTAFVCLRSGKEWTAGALVALASAIKAFPLLAIGYLAYRRHWKATVSTLVFLILLLIVVPSPSRGIRRNLEDLQTWTQGMLRYDAQSISQRPQRGFSYANQSLVAVAHRLLRPVNAHRKRARHCSLTLRILISSTSRS
jgi:Glycosyltransferase family 87